MSMKFDSPSRFLLNLATFTILCLTTKSCVGYIPSENSSTTMFVAIRIRPPHASRHYAGFGSKYLTSRCELCFITPFSSKSCHHLLVEVHPSCLLQMDHPPVPVQETSFEVIHDRKLFSTVCPWRPMYVTCWISLFPP